MVLFKKKKRDYKKIEKTLSENEDMRVNMVLLLMEIKPYRKSIFTQIHNPKHEIHKQWNKFNYEDKIEWIKKNMFTKWTKDEFVEHLITSMKRLSLNKAIDDSFNIILEVYK